MFTALPAPARTAQIYKTTILIVAGVATSNHLNVQKSDALDAADEIEST